MKLHSRAIEKPWGRVDLPPPFQISSATPIGEIWFENPSDRDLPLLVKYIFTSEKLSVQVHPNDDEARRRGLARGKNECWYILHAEEGATLGLGLRVRATVEELQAAAVDGSIEKLMDWRPVAPGDFIYVPAGTIHAIGAGIALLEVQQNADVTYRLYDYGRPRELHLEHGLAVAKRDPILPSAIRATGGLGDAILVDGPYFTLLLASASERIPASVSAKQRWIMPLVGIAESNGLEAAAGECLLLEPGAPLSISNGGTVLIATEGAGTG